MEIDKIYCGDCIEKMKGLGYNNVDITLTSPPYNLGKVINTGENVYNEYNDELSQDEYYKLIHDSLYEMIRVTKHYVFLNFQMLSNNKMAYLRLLHDFDVNVKDIIIWVKNQVQPAVHPTCLSSKFEFVVVFAVSPCAAKRRFNRAFFNNRQSGMIAYNVIQGDSASVKELGNEKIREHHATFPQYFVRWFLEKFSQKGDIILDPFAGTGTTLVVAKQMERHFLGFEIDPHYVEIANKKLKNVSSRLDSYL